MSSGALRPTWTSVVSVHSAHLSLDFYLSLMTGVLRKLTYVAAYYENMKRLGTTETFLISSEQINGEEASLTSLR